jgi:hypothetical protein
MKLEFSLATLLVLVAAIAIATAISVKAQVDTGRIRFYWNTVATDAGPETSREVIRVGRDPSTAEIVWRLTWAWPLSVAITLVLLWIVRQLRKIATQILQN